MVRCVARKGVMTIPFRVPLTSSTTLYSQYYALDSG